MEPGGRSPVQRRAFSPAYSRCRAKAGNRAVSLVKILLAHKYSVDRISNPMMRKSTPGKTGRTRPAIPARMKAQPQARAIHFFACAFSEYLPFADLQLRSLHH